MTHDYVAFLRRTLVWDYDSRNASDLACMLGRPVLYFRMFYVRSLSRGMFAPRADIDVLFFGSFNERRSRILDDLRERGLAVTAPYERLVEATEALVMDRERREAVAEEGFRVFSRRRAVDVLPEVFAWTADQVR